MPLPQNVNAILGAGVFGIVCAATLYVIEHYRQDRRRHAMAKDLARLDSELAVLRRELDNILTTQRQKYFYNLTTNAQLQLPGMFRGQKRAKKPKRVDSFLSRSTVSDDYISAADSSDLEFYDVSSDEGDNLTNLDLSLSRIDLTLEQGNIADLENCVEELQNLCLEFPENPQLLWRVGKAHYRLYEKTDEQDHLNKGIDACNTALGLSPELANVHKWLAILLGSRTKYQPLKQKILDGLSLKQHVDAAIRLSPLDEVLHHMLGRFCYDMAELKYYERVVASAVAADLPKSTHEEALRHFEEAEKLSKDPWKKNLLYIAKCKIKLGLVEEGVQILEKAAKTDNGKDDEDDVEIKELLKKYKR